MVRKLTQKDWDDIAIELDAEATPIKPIVGYNAEPPATDDLTEERNRFNIKLGLVILLITYGLVLLFGIMIGDLFF